MKRLLVVLMALSLSACAMLPRWQDDDQYLVHVVLIWLKQPGNVEHRRQIVQAARALREIPGVLDLRVGEVVGSDREVVEDGYDVGLMLRFRSAAELEAYLVHPVHVNTVKTRFVPLMARYRVMDFATP